MARYHRRLQTEPRFLGVFRGADLFLLGAGIAVNAVLQTFAGAALFLALVTAWVVLTRIGRPPGYAEHLVRSWWRPRLLRPGASRGPIPLQPP